MKAILFGLLFGSLFTASAQQQTMMIRLSEIEIDPVYLEEYKAILTEESAASVKLEPGVVAIFPMYQKEKPTSVRILEIYADRAAYEAHLKTPHFQKYKTTTLKMVKSLRLVDMETIDAATMPLIFKKLSNQVQSASIDSVVSVDANRLSISTIESIQTTETIESTFA